MASPNTIRKKEKDGSDLYNTPIEALVAANEAGLFDRFTCYYDPCNGLGEISDFLKQQGKQVYTSDKYFYGCEDEIIDFLEVTDTSLFECLIFNPPFLLSEEFIDHALSLCPHLIMFNRAAILETNNRSEKHKSKEWPLKEFWSFGNRVSCSEGIERSQTANSVWYGWFVYERGYQTKPVIDWLFTKKGS